MNCTSYSALNFIVEFVSFIVSNKGKSSLIIKLQLSAAHLLTAMSSKYKTATGFKLNIYFCYKLQWVKNYYLKIIAVHLVICVWKINPSKFIEWFSKQSRVENYMNKISVLYWGKMMTKYHIIALKYDLSLCKDCRKLCSICRR